MSAHATSFRLTLVPGILSQLPTLAVPRDDRTPVERKFGKSLAIGPTGYRNPLADGRAGKRNIRDRYTPQRANRNVTEVRSTPRP